MIALKPEARSGSLIDRIKALKAAIPHTIPVFTGFTFLGIAYGILMNSKGYGVLWTVLFSVTAFAGSAQYVAVTLLTSVFDPLYALLITLVVNARHLFYGISMLDRFKDTGRLKPYLIFGMCDETFSILCSTPTPEGISKKWFQFFVTLLDHIYWVMGSALGALLGSVFVFNTRGLDFVLTALFAVIFTEQWKSRKDHRPAIIGLGGSALCLLLFGPNNFIIPAMVVLLAALMAIRKSYEAISDGERGKQQ